MTLKLSKTLLIAGVIALAVSCGGEENTPNNGGNNNNNGGTSTTSTTLSALRDKATDTSSEYEITVKDLVVTAVYENYAQIEDATAGAQVNVSNHGLQVGQKFNGNVKVKARVLSGALLISSIDVSKATASTATTLPCTVTTLPDIVNDTESYMNRRVKLENVTFVTGFTGDANGSATFSQKGKQISSICRPAGIVIADGSQGDLICFPTSTSCLVYDSRDFTEHEFTSPLTEVSTYGVYSIVNEKPVEFYVYKSGTDEYAFSSDGTTREFRIQNFSAENFLLFSFPHNMKNGQEITLTTSVIGLSQFTDGTSQVIVEKISGDKLWLMDYEAQKGYVLRITEDE